MIVDFESLPLLEHPNFKGGTGRYLVRTYTDGKEKVMLGTLPPGSSIGYHTHETDCEVIVCLSGCGNVVLENGSETLLPGKAHYCPKGHSHSLQNNGTEDLRFYAIVTQQ